MSETPADRVSELERSTAMHFSQDWFSQHIPIWTRLLHEFKGKAGLRVLEIGTFEGRSTCWLLENIVTGEGAHIDCIDTFEGAEDMVALKLDMSNMRDVFESNIAPWRDRVSVYAGESAAVTRMREMFVYSELEQSLQAALAGDVNALEHAAALGEPQIEAVLAPAP